MVSLFLKGLNRGFYYASEGIVYSIASQRNMRIHVTAALLVLLIGMYLHIQYLDVLFILLAIGMVMTAEIFNTAVEKIVDLITKENHPLAKAAKDLAAGAVLLVVFFAIIIGILIMVPYFYDYYIKGWGIKAVHPASFFAQLGLFILILTYAVKAFWYNRNVIFQPQVLVGILLFLLSLSQMYTNWLSIPFALFIIIYIDFLLKTDVSAVGLMQNIIISIGGYHLFSFLFY